MKRPILALLCATVALTSCQTTHRVAVSTFRVIDAPHEYLRRKLDVDNDNPDRRTATTTTTTQTNVPQDNATYPQPFQEQQPPAPQPEPQRQVVVAPPPPPSRQIVTESVATPTPAPRVTSRSTTSNQSRQTETTTSTAPRNAGTEKASLPYAKPVPGKPGYVFSPYDKNGGYVDVTGFSPGSKVKDPYSGKVFLVP